MAKSYWIDENNVIYVDFDKATPAEMKAIETMTKCGFKLEPKRTLSEATKLKMVSPKAIYAFITSEDNAKKYAEIAKEWAKWKKEKVSCLVKKTGEKKLRAGGDMHARKVLKEKYAAEYEAIIKAIKAERGVEGF